MINTDGGKRINIIVKLLSITALILNAAGSSVTGDTSWAGVAASVCLLFHSMRLFNYDAEKKTISVIFALFSANGLFYVVELIMNLLHIEASVINGSWICVIVLEMLMIVSCLIVSIGLSQQWEKGINICLIAAFISLFFIGALSIWRVSCYASILKQFSAALGVESIDYKETFDATIRSILGTLGHFVLCVLLFLFCLENKFFRSSLYASKTVEQALAVLEDKRKLGIITEEEYQAERAKIIASL